jgi:Xaa-Pro dipeptidase
MQTIQPSLRIGRDVWDAAAMPVEEFEARVARLRASMSDAHIDAMLLYGNGMDECGYPAYVSNFVVKFPRADLVILPRDGAPVLMFQGPARERTAATKRTWIEDIRPSSNVAQTCVEALREKELLNATIGLAGARTLMPNSQWQELSAALGNAKLLDVESSVEKLRAIKSNREIAEIQKASQIVTGALRRFEKANFDTVNEALLAARLTYDARIQGAEDVRVLIGRPGESGWALRPVEDLTIADSETVVLHIAASWEHYWSEATRTYTVSVGNFHPVWNKDYEKQFNSIVDRLQPGRMVADVAVNAVNEMGPTCAALAEEYGVGHSVGMTRRELPLLSTRDDTKIENGMCFAIQVVLPIPGGGCIFRGDTVVVMQNRPTLLPVG